MGLKESVERSLLPRAIFLILHETGLQSLKTTSARCFFLLKCQRKDSNKAKEQRHFRGVLGAGVQPRSTIQLFMPVSGVEKPPFSQFCLAFGVSLARKSLSWPAMPVSNKKQVFEQRKRIKLFVDFWVRAYRFEFAPSTALSTVDEKSRFSCFQFWAFWSSGLASSASIFSPVLFRFFFIVFVYARAKIGCNRFLISTCEKLWFLKADRVG